jgi:RNA polymerase sigma-70 factor (ECF subfamily)
MDDDVWLISREIPNLRGFARALVGDHSAADDLVRICLESAVRKRRFRLRRGGVKSWLLRILYKAYLKRGRGRFSEDLEDSESLSSEPPGRAGPRGAVAGLSLLPNPQREAILLMALQDLGYDEAAWVLGVSVGALRARLARGRETLRDIAAGSFERSAPPLRRVK